MAFKLHIEGEGRKIGFYKINRLEIEGLEIEPDAEFDRETIQEIFENVNAFIESGELDELDESCIITACDPETARITLDADNQEEVELAVDDFTLYNLDVDKRLTMLQKTKIGDIVFVRTEVGDAYWDLSGEGEESFDAANVTIGYLDCSRSHDSYEVLRESYYDFLCDLVLPDDIRYKEENLSLDEHLLRTSQVWGELYIVRDNLPDHRKILERVDMGGPILLDTTATPEELA